MSTLCWIQLSKAALLCYVITGYKEKVFYSKGGEALAQAAQRRGGCSILGGTQGQAGEGSEHLMELWVSLCIVEGCGLDGLSMSLPPETIL